MNTRNALLALGLASALSAPVARADSFFGNQFMIGSPPVPVAVDQANNQWTRFTCWDGAKVTAAQVYLGDGTGAVTLSLQEDKEGVPSGKDLATATISAAQNGWNRATFGTPVELKPDHVYYLVMTVPGAGSVNWISVNLAARGTQPSGATDPVWARGSGTSPETRTGLTFFLETESGASFGQPYTLRHNSSVMGGRKIPAQRFIFQPAAGGGETVAAVSLVLGVATDESITYKVVILDAKNNALETKEVSSLDLPPGPPKMVTIPLAGTTKLTPGETYSLAFYSEAPTGKVSWVGAATNADDAGQKATWQGTEGHAFSYEGTDLKAEGAHDANRDLVFYFDMQ